MNNNKAKGIFLLNNVYLTQRQLEVLRCILCGLSAKQAALNLSISYRTVEKYLEIVKSKFDCKKTAELVATCIKYHLVGSILGASDKDKIKNNLPDLHE